MLASLSIRDIVLIDSLDLMFDAGLSALTGETGAGKSILLGALGLACGERAERAQVRAGADKAVAIAMFEPPVDHPVYALLDEAGVDVEAGEAVILRPRRPARSAGRGAGGDPWPARRTRPDGPQEPSRPAGRVCGLIRRPCGGEGCLDKSQ
nr:AAA family ATPase [Oceanicaulis alexandrii]